MRDKGSSRLLTHYNLTNLSNSSNKSSVRLETVLESFYDGADGTVIIDFKLLSDMFQSFSP